MTVGRVIQTLERRANWLRARQSTLPPERGGAAYEAAEIAALEYALGVIEDAHAIGLPNLGRLTVEDRKRLRRLLEGEEEAA